jgi:hypothetical protein
LGNGRCKEIITNSTSLLEKSTPNLKSRRLSDVTAGISVAILNRRYVMDTSKMTDMSKIKEHMMIHAKSEGNMPGEPFMPVGTVDHMDGEKYIKLTKSDTTDGQHHWIPVDWVESVDEQSVYLNKTQEELMTELMNEKPSS